MKIAVIGGAGVRTVIFIKICILRKPCYMI